jgi:predicted transcriptional regulator
MKAGEAMSAPRGNGAEVEEWGAVGDPIRNRMRELEMSTAKLAREAGLSQTTVRYLGRSEIRHNRSALVAISAVLRWRHDHLLNILRGEPHRNVRVKPPLEYVLRQIVHSEIGPVKEDIAVLKDIVREMRDDGMSANDS